MIDKIPIKGLGQTIEHNGEVILVSADLPVDCMVLFIDMKTWSKIKGEVIKESE